MSFTWLPMWNVVLADTVTQELFWFLFALKGVCPNSVVYVNVLTFNDETSKF